VEREAWHFQHVDASLLKVLISELHTSLFSQEFQDFVQELIRQVGMISANVGTSRYVDGHGPFRLSSMSGCEPRANMRHGDQRLAFKLIIAPSTAMS
jgi:hypothetical protein